MPTRVVAATDVHARIGPAYEVEFSDGTVIVADAEHQWLTGHGVATVGAGRSGAQPDRNQRTFAAVRTTGRDRRTLRARRQIVAQPLGRQRQAVPGCRGSSGAALHVGRVARANAFDHRDPEIRHADRGRGPGRRRGRLRSASSADAHPDRVPPCFRRRSGARLLAGLLDAGRHRRRRRSGAVRR